ncbi:hypothetical protein AURDEDRAFT_158663 [Auricularia subglabra TFB-10046 SS5]|nr:hypothetical protein AURDEDRAFT_158663 [Auricularia subglabra TFB-10046 SS5]
MAYAAYQPYMPPAPAVPFDPRMRTWHDWSYEDVKQVPDLAQEEEEAAMLARPVADLFPDPDGGVPSYAPPPKAITAGPASEDPLAAHSTPGKAQYKMGHDYLHWDNPKARQQQAAMDPVLYNFAVDWPTDVQEQFAEIALNPTTHTLVPHQAPLAYTPAHKMPMAPSIAYASGSAVYDAPPAILPSGPAFAGALPPLEPAGIAPEMALALVPAPEPAAQPYQYVNNINKPSIVRPPSAPPTVLATPLPPLQPQGAATTVAAIAAASGKLPPTPLPARSPFPVTTAPLFPHATPMPPAAAQPPPLMVPTPGKENNKPKAVQKPLKSAMSRTPFMDPADQLAWNAPGPYPAQITPGTGAGRRRGASFSSVQQTGTLPGPYISPVSPASRIGQWRADLPPAQANGRAHMAPTAQLEHMASQVAEQRGPGAINFPQGYGAYGYGFHPSPTGAAQPEPPTTTSKVKNLLGLGSGGGKDRRKPAPSAEMMDPLFGGVPVAQDSWYQRTPSLADQQRQLNSQRAQDEAHRKALAQAAKVHGSGKGTKTGKIGTTPLPPAPTHFASFPGGFPMGMDELTDAYATFAPPSKGVNKKKR